MMVVKKRQIAAVSLVLMVLIAGYLNWTFNGKDMEGAETYTAENLGEVKPVSEPIEAVDSQGDAGNEDAAPVVQENAALTEARQSKEASKKESIATLEGLINNPNADEESRRKAEEEMIALAKNGDTETVIQNLIRAKGLGDAVVYINEQGCTVTIASEKLGKSQTAQIQEIIMSQTNITADGIKIIEVK